MDGPRPKSADILSQGDEPKIIYKPSIEKFMLKAKIKETADNIITVYGGTTPIGLTQREFLYWMNVIAVTARNNDETPVKDENFKATLDAIAGFYSYFDVHNVGLV